MNIEPPRPATRDIATDNDVGVLVRSFYRAAVPDELLGPVFEGFKVDWSRHIPKLVGYWTHVLLDGPATGTNTVRAHRAVQQVAPFGDAHIERWVELWCETVDDRYVGPRAERAKARAAQVGRVLQSRLPRNAQEDAA